ncbi:Phosphatidylinositol 4-phosphate 3-kinase C2 domain-containing subunit alpha [Homalodisca vitripennis]|nr:Phosphatidylinositol 4-phosphate 3-kinase C2 domain-containing subunit alpha [Homalodisca vitripennis]
MQAVKAVCALLGSVETLDITTALDSFNQTLEREMERVEASIQGGSEVSIQPRGVMQAVKAVCALLGSVETLDITTALDSFNQTLEREMERVEASIQGGSEVSIQPRGVMQAVKAVCALLGSVETLDITTALDSFNRVSAQLSQTPQVVCVNISYLNNK